MHEFLTLEGLRIDGRRPNEFRAMTAKIGGVVTGADGSAYLECGLTKVIAYVHGPTHGKKRSTSSPDKASVVAEYMTATFGTIDRKRKSKGDRTSQERSLWIQRIFEHAILTDQFPRSQIEIYVEVLQQDGSPVSTAVNAVTLALIDAGIPLRDLVVACTVGAIDNKTVLADLNNAESEKAAGAAQLVMAVYSRTGDLCLCECESKLPVASFELAYGVAQTACRDAALTLRSFAAEQASRRISGLLSLSGRKRG